MTKFYNEEGEEVEAIPQEEFQKLQEEREALVKEKEELLAEKERLEKGGNNKDENIAKLRTWAESNEKQLQEVTRKLTEREEYEKTTLKNNLFTHYAGADDESRKKLEEAYQLVNIDESNPENIAKRMENAAKLSGLYREETTSNPIFQHGVFGGAGPVLKTTGQKDDKNIVETDQGKQILGAMGVPVDDKK